MIWSWAMIVDRSYQKVDVELLSLKCEEWVNVAMDLDLGHITWCTDVMEEIATAVKDLGARSSIYLVKGATRLVLITS
jgi:hypothetical protein